MILPVFWFRPDEDEQSDVINSEMKSITAENINGNWLEVFHMS